MIGRETGREKETRSNGIWGEEEVRMAWLRWISWPAGWFGAWTPEPGLGFESQVGYELQQAPHLPVSQTHNDSSHTIGLSVSFE